MAKKEVKAKKKGLPIFNNPPPLPEPLEKEKNKGGHPIYWDDERKKEAIDEILTQISNGKSVRSILDNADRLKLPSCVTFTEWLSDDSKLAKQYAHACEMRADYLFEQMLEIADDKSQDTVMVVKNDMPVEVENREYINRSRLRVDTRKWFLSKLQPKKYGDKLDLTTDGEKIENKITTIEIVRVKKNEDTGRA